MDAPRCRTHPGVAAAWRCEACGALACDACVNSAMAGAVRLNSCRACRGRCVSLREPPPGAPGAAPPAPRPFLAQVPGAFAFPFRGSGWLLLSIGAVFFWLVAVANRMMFSLFLGLFGGGYLAAYLLRIVAATANGEDEMPPWPGAGDFWDDILVPFFSFVAVFAACFGPAALAGIAGWYWSLGLAVTVPAVAVLGLLGLIGMPMAVLAVAVYNSVEALRPRIVLRAIARIPGDYALALLVLLGLAVYRTVAGVLAGAIPYAGSLVNGAISLYCAVVEMRLLGLLYRTHEARLDWFPADGGPPPVSLPGGPAEEPPPAANA